MQERPNQTPDQESGAAPVTDVVKIGEMPTVFAVPCEPGPEEKFSGRFDTVMYPGDSPVVPDHLTFVTGERHASAATARMVAEQAIVHV